RRRGAEGFRASTASTGLHCGPKCTPEETGPARVPAGWCVHCGLLGPSARPGPQGYAGIRVVRQRGSSYCTNGLRRVFMTGSHVCGGVGRPVLPVEVRMSVTDLLPPTTATGQLRRSVGFW